MGTFAGGWHGPQGPEAGPWPADDSVPGPGTQGGAAADAGSLVYSAAQVVCCGKDEATLARRAASIGRDPAEVRATGLAGSPAEIVDKLGAYAEAGTEAMYLQVLDLDDLDHLADIADQVMPQI